MTQSSKILVLKESAEAYDALKGRADAAVTAIVTKTAELENRVTTATGQAEDAAALATNAAGIKTANSYAEIPGTVGLYRVLSGAEAGRVYERPAAGGDPVRREALESARAVDVQRVQALAENAQPQIEGLVDHAGAAIPDGALGVPNYDQSLLRYRQRSLKIHSDPYGMQENATVLSVIASEDPDPRTEILGLTTREEASVYTARDTAAAYIGAVARAVNRSNAPQTTYTANGAYVPGADLSKLRRGMWVDTEHRNNGQPEKWSGLLLSWDITTQTITVDRWDNAARKLVGGIPTNGSAARLNVQTAIWGANVTAVLNPLSGANTAYGLEITTANNRAAFDPTLPEQGDDNTRVIGVGVYNINKTGFAGVDVAGDNRYGYRALGPKFAGFGVHHHPGNPFQAIPPQSPDHGFLDASLSKNAFRVVGAHDFGLWISETVREAGVLIDSNSYRGIIVRGDSFGGGRIYTAGDGVHWQVEAKSVGANPPRQALRVSADSNTTGLELGNNTRLLAVAAEPDVLRIEAVATLFSGHVRANAYQVGEKQVLGARRAAIPNSDGTMADNARAINAVLEAMRAHGLIES